MKKRILALLLAVVMVCGLLPVGAAATDEPPTSAKATVDFTVQSENAFLCAPQYSVVVSGSLSDDYGYVDTIAADKGVSTLDVFLKAHEVVFGTDFTAASKDTYLEGNSGYFSSAFGQIPNWGFAVNGGIPNDGIWNEIYDGYTGYAINQAEVKSGDLVSFFSYQDMYCGDALAYLDLSPTTAATGSNVTVSVKSISAMQGFSYATPAAMKAAAGVTAGAQLAWLNTSTGALTAIDGAITGEDGKATVTAPSEAGTYYLAAYDTGDNTPLVMQPAMLLVSAPQTVTVKIAPKTVTATFYSGANANLALNSSDVTDNGVVGNFHQYTLNVLPGTYSYRGMDGTTDLGGESFTVSKTETINLLRANIRYNGAALNQEGDYSFTLKNGDNDVVCGTPYVTSDIRYTPTLLIAGSAHSGTVTLAEKWLDTFYLSGTGTGKDGFSNTPSKTATSAATVNLPITQYKIIRVTAPTAATTTFYKQDANYVVEPVTPDSRTENSEAGTMTYLFKGTAAHSNYQFRSMMPGKMTQAGYLADGNDITVNFSDADRHSTTSAMAYDDNSVLLNVSAKNKLSMRVGETFKLRAFRAAWEIINTITGNQMIEPDFHYAILSGVDVVSIETTTECTNSKYPNAKNGNATGNWMNVTAEKNGTAVVAVWYDAINVYNANPPEANAWSVFGATDPARYGVFVVSVGDDSSVTWNPVSHDGDWDAEFDTVYYNGDAGCFTFKPTEEVTNVTVRNVYDTDLGAAQTVTASEDGSYAVPVTTGANIIAVTTAAGTDYQIVRAKKISYTITNNTTGESAVNSAPAIHTEDSVTISFDKLDMPIPKMSGIYNPGYMGTAKTAYELNDSLLLTSAGTQYDFSTKNSITFIAHVAGENSLKGYISPSSMGDPFGNHRNINDDGKPVNMNAGEVFGDFGVLPDITFTVTDNGKKASYEDATKITKLTVKGANSTGYLTGFTNWTTVGDGNSNWTADAATVAGYTLTANVVTKDYNNKLQLRYWYDGEAVKTADLIAGATNTINGFTLDANKILNLQVVITPADPTLGDAKAYTYLVYPGKSNLKYVHPVIKSLTAKNGDETLVMKPVLNTADTAYTLCVGDAEKISLSGEQLIKIYNTAVTADQSDSVVLTKMKDGSPVGDSITILEAGAPTNPNRYWTCSDVYITDADTLQIKVTSYVDDASARTYTFALDRITGSENEKKAQTVDAQIAAIGEVKLETEEAIIAARQAFDALTDAQKALVTKLSVLTEAEAALEALKNPPAPPDPPAPPVTPGGEDDGGTITVTFRLIGAEKAARDVDLGTDEYLPKYVTWLPTDSYQMEKNATVYDLFTEALDGAGLKYVGAESNYVSTIYAPASVGGYALSEFTNGSFSGWMYTVNGSHPGVGLTNRRLKDGDAVVWHYVNDYRYEVADWKEGSVGTSAQQNLWLKAADIAPKAPETDTGTDTGSSSGGKISGKTANTGAAEAAPDTDSETNAGEAETRVEISAQHISEAVAAAVKDGAESIVITPAAEGDADRIEVSLPVSAIQDLVRDTDVALTVQTEVGSLHIPNDTLAEIVAAAGDADISVTVETADAADIRAGLPEGVKTENAVAVRFTITAGEQTVSSFGGKALAVSFPVDTGVYETGRSYVVYVVSDDGSVSKTTAEIRNGNAVVTMTHFSTVILTEEEALPFMDIDGHWGYDAIRYAYHNGLMNGVGDGRFDPDGTLNRAMLVTILYRMEGEPTVTAENPFDDVKEGRWYTDAVIWAAENGLVNGYGNGKFAPEDEITREQMAKILFAHAKLRGFDVTRANDLAAYIDADKISAWALEAMRWANAGGLITGRTAETLVPGGNATRAEAAAILMRYLENAEKK